MYKVEVNRWNGELGVYWDIIAYDPQNKEDWQHIGTLSHKPTPQEIQWFEAQMNK